MTKACFTFEAKFFLVKFIILFFDGRILMLLSYRCEEAKLFLEKSIMRIMLVFQVLVYFNLSFYSLTFLWEIPNPLIQSDLSKYQGKLL